MKWSDELSIPELNLQQLLNVNQNRMLFVLSVHCGYCKKLLPTIRRLDYFTKFSNEALEISWINGTMPDDCDGKYHWLQELKLDVKAYPTIFILYNKKWHEVPREIRNKSQSEESFAPLYNYYSSIKHI